MTSDQIITALFEGRIPNIVTWVGTVFGLVGLLVTYRQAVAAKSAAERAAKIVMEFESKMALSRLSVASSQFDSLKNIIGLGHYQVAIALVSPLRRSLIQATAALTKQDDVESGSAVATKNLRAVERQLDLAARGDDKFQSSIVVKALSGIDELIADIETKLLYRRGGCHADN